MSVATKRQYNDKTHDEKQLFRNLRSVIRRITMDPVMFVSIQLTDLVTAGEIKDIVRGLQAEYGTKYNMSAPTTHGGITYVQIKRLS